jgi:hypothetical protein
MSILSQLQEAGATIYGGANFTPGAVIVTVTLGENITLAKSERYPDTMILTIKEGNTSAYIPVRRDVVIAGKTQFTLQQFTATRDWPERNIVAGVSKVFAI